MHSPIAAGFVSSKYGKRAGGFHAGMDLRVDGDFGEPAFAAFAGSVERVVADRVHDRDPNQPKNAGKQNIAPGRTGNGVVVRRSDGERQVYGHVAPAVRVGDAVTEGQRLGKVDNSGNTSGPHVHYEEWTATKETRNPMVSFLAFGVEIVRRGAAAAVAPPSEKVQRKLADMGLETTAAGVRQYQRSHGLFVDGDWGDVTETYFQFVRDLQEYLNTWDAVQPPVRVDGDRGPKTKAAEKQAKTAANAQRRYEPPAEPPKIG